MRILNIFFKNINSLEGEGRVYFDQGPIAESGVFAITGPNGSGKSSILDVITLGLYGETYRFDKPAAHVITQQTQACFAQVEFALGGEKYRSSWRVQYGDGSSQTELSAPEMRLLRIGEQEEILAETPVQVRQRIAELTGMDFHKFSKSMVLPQGDFAAFLNALDSERMDILEKISGTDIYAQHRQQAESQFAQSLTRLTQIQQDLGLIPLLTQEALEAANEDLQDFKQQVAELKNQQTQNQSLLNNLQSSRALQQQRNTLLVRLDQYQQDLQRISDAQNAEPWREGLAVLDAKQAQLQQAQSTLDNYRRELAMLQQQLGSTDSAGAVLPNKSVAEQKQAIDALKLTISELKLELPRETELSLAIQQQLGEKQAALSEVDLWLQAHQADAALVADFPDVVGLRNLRAELKGLSAQHKNQAQWSKNTGAVLKKHSANLQSHQTHLRDVQTQLAADQATLLSLAQGKSFDEWKELLQDQQARVNDFKELNALADVTATISKKGWFGWFGRKQQEGADEAELQVKLDNLQQALSREQNIAAVLEKAIRNEALIKKYSGDRDKLVDGQPCFLCGGLRHPYVLKPPVLTDSKKALIDQRGKIQTMKSQLDSLTAQLKVAQKRGSQLSAKQKRLQQIRVEWSSLANRLNIMRDGMNMENLSLQKLWLAEETEELNKISSLVKEHAQLLRNIAKLTADIERKQALTARLTEAVENAQAVSDNRPAEFIDIEQNYNNSVAAEKALVTLLEKQLNALGEKLPAAGKENLLFDRLNSRRQDYQIYSMRQQGLQTDLIGLHERLQASQAKVADYQQQMSASLTALSGEEVVGLHLAVLEKQKLIVDQEKTLQWIQAEFDALLQNLSTQVVASGFADLAALQASLALIDQQADIQQRHTADTLKLAEVDAQLSGLSALLYAEDAIGLGALNEDDIQRQLQTLAEQLDIARQEVRSLENKLDKQFGYRERYQSLQTQLLEQQQLFAQAEAEIKLINDEQGGFRRRVQQLMIDKLLSQTNQILEKLSGRYYVRNLASEHGLALEIEDTQQKNARRQPQTLSGGESFVVSLALALALAEIANNGKAIDSLFLDEGFGNLDAEALYLAMSTLEGLKTQGKTVGVISHVDAVKKRIKTQIELVKKPNGLSELKMVA